MFDRLLGRTASKRTEGHSVVLTDDEVKALASDFTPLDGVEPGLTARVMAYVLKGEDGKVLGTLEKRRGCGAALGLRSCYGAMSKEQKELKRGPIRQHFYQHILCDDPVLFYRLAMVYEAAAKQDSDHPIHWLVTFLQEASYGKVHVRSIEAMLSMAGEPPDALAKVVLLGKGGVKKILHRETCGSELEGFNDYMSRYRDFVLEALRTDDISDRNAIRFIMWCGYIKPDGYWVEVIAAKDRADARAKAHPVDEDLASEANGWTILAIPLTMRKARDGTHDERLRAAETLTRWCPDKVHAFLEVRSRVEPDVRVRDALRGLVQQAMADAGQPLHSDECGLAPVAKIDPITPASARVLEGMRSVFNEYNQDMLEQRRRLAEKGQAYGGRATVPEGDLVRMHALLTDTTAIGDHREFSLEYDISMQEGIPDGEAEYLRPLLEEPDLGLLHVLRLWLMLGRSGFSIFGLPERITYYRQHHKLRFSLRDLAVALEAVGVSGEEIAHDYLMHSEYRWEDEAVWPYFAERPWWFERALTKGGTKKYEGLYTERTARLNALRVVAMLPRVPEGLVERLWVFALGREAEERGLAQRILEKCEGFKDRLVGYLDDGNKVRRANAVEWLGRLNVHATVPRLTEMVTSDREDLVKSRAAGALASMEVDTGGLVDRDAFIKEASKGMARGLPKSLEWLDMNAVPEARWAGTGELVTKEVVGWLLVRNLKLKDPAPDHLLRHYATWFRKEDGEAIALHIMQRWVEQDTRPKYTSEQCEEMAARTADQYAQYGEAIRKRHYDYNLRRNRDEMVGNANDTRGVLAVAGALGGAAMVPIVREYLARWYGRRYTQCNYLMSALEWVDEPAAIHLLLSVSQRFRTRVIREHAKQLVEAISARKGWSQDELGDRTIPTAGLDDGGTLVLDYGGHRFYATIGSDLGLDLKDEVGNQIETLPPPAPGDDAALVEDAGKELKAVAKEIGAVERGQTDRLYEAMCTQRAWTFPVWDGLLNRHPIVSMLCRRVVWMAQEPDGRTVAFRPEGGGPLIDRDGTPVAVGHDSLVRVAHVLTLPPGASADWAGHLKSRGIKPLIGQFPKDPFVLPTEMAGAYELDDFLGHIIQGKRLTALTKRLGYLPGPVLEGKSFYEYRRKFESCGIEACIEFTGHPTFNDGFRIALKHLFFNQLAKRAPTDTSELWNRARLGDVPPLLLSEAHGHMGRIADESLGLDPQWETQP